MLRAQQSSAQDDANDTPLGDIARSLRKNASSSQGVIDNENLSSVVDEAEGHHAAGEGLRFLMSGAAKGFQVAAPDATCSLTFTAAAKSLLSSQYAQMDLPPGEMQKLAGPATIEGDALTVTVFNGTDWHVSEVAVALTIVRKNRARDASLSFGTVEGLTSATMPLAEGDPSEESEVRPEKKSDLTVIYRMRSAALPFATTVFSAPLDLDLAPGDEWHWAIVQAKGYPPRGLAAGAVQSSAQSSESASDQPEPGRAPLPPQDSAGVLLPQGSQNFR